MTREEAISRINNDLECHKKELSAPYKTALNMAIEALKFCEVYDKTIEAVNKFYDDHHAQIVNWTPCSERLPEHTGFYLIQHSRECCTDEMAVAFYSVEEHEIDPDYCWEFSSVGDVQEVIAWMPLPEPYKGDKE